MSTEIQSTTSAKGFFGRDVVIQKFAEILGKNAPAFITSVLQAVNSNGNLSNSTPESVYNAAMVAATLKLPINNNLGFAYIVPYRVKQKDGQYVDAAQFQLGYKGFIQLAQRSGQVKKIYATEIYQDEILSADPLNGYEFTFVNRGTKDQSPTIVGYAAKIVLLNGFESILYMTVDQLRQHGKKYSKTFDFGIWKNDFDSMAKKTVLKLLLSKCAPLSIEMQKALITDQAVINNEEATDITYVDNEPKPLTIEANAQEKEDKRVLDFIANAKTLEDLEQVEAHLNEVTSIAYGDKKEFILEQSKAKK